MPLPPFFKDFKKEDCLGPASDSPSRKETFLAFISVWLYIPVVYLLLPCKQVSPFTFITTVPAFFFDPTLFASQFILPHPPGQPLKFFPSFGYLLLCVSLKICKHGFLSPSCFPPPLPLNPWCQSIFNALPYFLSSSMAHINISHLSFQSFVAA